MEDTIMDKSMRLVDPILCLFLAIVLCGTMFRLILSCK